MQYGDEQARLASLRGLRLLDTPCEERFDRIVRLACRALNTPTALITLVDAERQWFKARVGFSLGETHRDVSFCSHAIGAPAADLLVVPDVTKDDRFASNPFVVGPPHVRFYAAQPIHAPDGRAVGTLCVIDSVPRQLSPTERVILRDLGTMVDELLSSPAFVSEDSMAALEMWDEKIHLAFERSGIGTAMLNPKGELYAANEAYSTIFGYPLVDMLGKSPGQFRHENDHFVARAEIVKLFSAEIARLSVEVRIKPGDRDIAWLRVHLARLDSSGGDSTILLQVEDVTRRHQLDDALRHRRDMQRAAVDAISHGVVLTDEHGHIHLMNPAAERILGYSATELEHLHPERIHQFIKTATSAGAVIEWVRPDTQVLTLRLTSGSLANVEQNPSLTVIGLADLTNERAQQSHLIHQATHDALTGLPNRTLFESSLTSALANAGNTGNRIAVCFIDLDGFKVVNDIAGHDAGDSLLRRAAIMIKSLDRGHDLVARFGGDEFVVLLDPVVDEAEAYGIAQSIVNAVRRNSDDYQDQKVSVSIGVTGNHADDTAASIIARADAALCRAKAAGKNRATLYCDASSQTQPDLPVLLLPPQQGVPLVLPGGMRRQWLPAVGVLAASTALSVAGLASSERVAQALFPFIHVLQLGTLVAGVRRRGLNHRCWWFLGGIMAFCIPAAFFGAAAASADNRLLFLRAAYASGYLALISGVIGAALITRPLAQVPRLAAQMAAIIGGITASGLVYQWLPHARPGTSDTRTIWGVAFLAVIGMVIAFPSLVTQLRSLGRSAEVWLAAGAVVYAVGQLSLASAMHNSSTRIAGPAALACGLIVASAFSPDARSVGTSLQHLLDDGEQLRCRQHWSPSWLQVSC